MLEMIFSITKSPFSIRYYEPWMPEKPTGNNYERILCTYKPNLCFFYSSSYSLLCLETSKYMRRKIFGILWQQWRYLQCHAFKAWFQQMYFIFHVYHDDVIWWSWHLKSPVIRCLFHILFRIKMKKASKLLITDVFFKGKPITKDKWGGKRFHARTAYWEHRL